MRIFMTWPRQVSAADARGRNLSKPEGATALFIERWQHDVREIRRLLQTDPDSGAAARARMRQSDGSVKRNADACENDGAINHLQRREPRAEPQPFNGRRERRGEALHQQQRQARTQPRQGLEQRDIAHTDADDSTQQK